MPETRRYHSITFLSSTTVTGAIDTSTSSVDVGEYQELTVFMKVSSVSGTGTIDITMQVSDNATDWADHTSFTTITDSGNSIGKITGNIARHCRFHYVIAGFTSVTLSISAIAKT